MEQSRRYREGADGVTRSSKTRCSNTGRVGRVRADVQERVPHGGQGQVVDGGSTPSGVMEHAPSRRRITAETTAGGPWSAALASGLRRRRRSPFPRGRVKEDARVPRPGTRRRRESNARRTPERGPDATSSVAAPAAAAIRVAATALDSRVVTPKSVEPATNRHGSRARRGPPEPNAAAPASSLGGSARSTSSTTTDRTRDVSTEAQTRFVASRNGAGFSFTSTDPD